MSCKCSGMEYVGSRMVFTGQCEHTRERRVQERMKLLKKAGVIK